MSDTVDRELEEAVAPEECVGVTSSEVYAWHPQTIARPKACTFIPRQMTRSLEELQLGPIPGRSFLRSTVQEVRAVESLKRFYGRRR